MGSVNNGKKIDTVDNGTKMTRPDASKFEATRTSERAVLGLQLK